MPNMSMNTGIDYINSLEKGLINSGMQTPNTDGTRTPSEPIRMSEGTSCNNYEGIQNRKPAPDNFKTFDS